jgi:signal recognition particle subunit SRP54
MVLLDLGKRINGALASLAHRPKIDEEALEGVLKEICRALLESDVNVRLVQDLRKNIRSVIDFDELAKSPAASQRKLIQKAVFEELVSLVNPGVEPWTPSKGKSNIVMFVGLQGSGKTTSCTKVRHLLCFLFISCEISK